MAFKMLLWLNKMNYITTFKHIVKEMQEDVQHFFQIKTVMIKIIETICLL